MLPVPLSEKERAVVAMVMRGEEEVEVIWERSLALLFEMIDLLKRARDMVTLILFLMVFDWCCCD